MGPLGNWYTRTLPLQPHKYWCLDCVIWKGHGIGDCYYHHKFQPFVVDPLIAPCCIYCYVKNCNGWLSANRDRDSQHHNILKASDFSSSLCIPSSAGTSASYIPLPFTHVWIHSSVAKGAILTVGGACGPFIRMAVVITIPFLYQIVRPPTTVHVWPCNCQMEEISPVDGTIRGDSIK